MTELGKKNNFLPPSKRAARRLIQRAFVLMGRERYVRQHLREARLISLWIIEDWNLSWTVELERGKLRFERRPSKHPDVTLTWRTAESFFNQREGEAKAQEGFEMIGDLESRRSLEPFLRAFGKVLSGVIRNPFDEEGNPLA